MKLFHKIPKVILLLPFFATIQVNTMAQKTLILEKMTVSWEYGEDSIIFSLTTPTQGWQAIGFNQSTQLKGTYLIMARIKNGKAEVDEHYTESPGRYKSLTTYGIQQRAVILDFMETKNKTFIRFSLPIHGSDKKHKTLSEGRQYTLLYAYSLEDDFQHHSTFRNSTIINL